MVAALRLQTIPEPVSALACLLGHARGYGQGDCGTAAVGRGRSASEGNSEAGATGDGGPDALAGRISPALDVVAEEFERTARLSVSLGDLLRSEISASSPPRFASLVSSVQ